MTASERAAQIWTVLIFAAYHRQTVGVDVLGRLLGVAPEEVGPWLAPIRGFCLRHGLPPLASIVVGDPGDEALVSPSELHREQSLVFHHSWLDAETPTPADLEASEPTSPDHKRAERSVKSRRV